MRRRLDLAMTLVGRPRLIFLDEPTTGLDPRSRRTMWQSIRELVAEGTTILLTTQYLEEADQLADRIGVLDGGRLVAEGTAAELKRSLPGGHIRLAVHRSRRPRRPRPGCCRRRRATRRALALTVPSDGGMRALRSLLDRLDDASVAVEDLTIHTPDLDDVFLALTGEGDPTTSSEEAR